MQTTRRFDDMHKAATSSHTRHEAEACKDGDGLQNKVHRSRICPTLSLKVGPVYSLSPARWLRWGI